MNTNFFTTAIMAALALSANASEVTETQESTDSKNLKLSEVFSKPKLSGYMIGNYNATFKDNGNSNGFSLRMIRLIMTGRVLGDFEYKLQGQINGNTGTYGDSPRLIDMSVEW
ncbi:MAG: porin, partial [Prevotellaceae bacterium]|nr:porin [Prevotellaceae bacterium]